MTTIIEDAVTAAEAAEVAAREQLRGWREKAAQFEADAERLTEQLGDVALTDFDAVPGLQSQIAAAQAGAGAAGAAVKAAERAVRTARDGVLLARAEVLRGEAAGLWEQARDHQAVTDRLVAELAQHEGVAYLPVMIGNIGQAVPLPTVTDGLVEQAKAKDAEAAGLVAPLRGEAVQVRVGPVRAGGKQQVVIAGRAVVEQGQSRHVTVLVDGEPLLMDDGRPLPVAATYGQPDIFATVEVPFGSTVEARGLSEASAVTVDG